MGSVPEVGVTYRYEAEEGLGGRARVADPTVSDDLPAEMRELDMTTDTRVTVSGYDDERDLVLVDWTDGQGNPRTTSLEPEVLDEHFSRET